MAQNIEVDTIFSNLSFRDVAHIVGTLIFGYILLRLSLRFLDATHIGLSWLQTHQYEGLTIIIFILINSILVIDFAISRGRRHYNDEKYSIVEIGVSYLKEKTTEIKSGSIEPGTGLMKSDVSSLTDMIGSVDKDEIMKKPKMANPIIKPTETKHMEKPTRMGDLVSDSKLTQEPETNIKFKEVIPVKLSYDRRIIKSIESPHSISIIDFKSKVSKKDVEIKIEFLKSSSRLATPIISKHKMVYESINIWVNVSEDDIEEPSIRIKVDRNWFDSNNILTIELQQYINGTWNIIPTKRISQDSNHIFYDAYVTKISAPYAIIGTGL